MKPLLPLATTLLLLGSLLSFSCHKDQATAQPTPATTSRWVNTAHLDHLYQTVKLPNAVEVGTVAIYSEAPDYHLVADSDEGYTCVDDVSRAALFWLREPDIATNTTKQTQLRKTIEFVLQQQSSNGYFYNFLFPNLSVNTAGPTSVNQPNFWSWRALWCLSESYPYYLKADPALATRLQTAIKQTVSNMVRDFGAKPLEYTFVKGLKIPQWLPYGSGTDQAAIMLLGLLNSYQQTPDAAVLALMNQLANGILQMQPGDPATAATVFPYGAFLSFENNWHAYAGDQAYALLRAGKVLNKPDWVAAAKREVDNFYPYLLKQGLLESFAVEQAGSSIRLLTQSQYAQIAYGVRPFAWAAMEAYDQTQDARYADTAAQLLSWFLGNNAAKTVMYDRTTGRCFDGIISATQVNHNAGAESTIEALWAMQKLDSYPAVAQLLENTADMAEVRLEHIAKAYDTGPRVIGDVSIDVRDKEFVVLVGPSGCGKSTLLRMIAGLETITAGNLLLDGRRINDLPPKDRDIAMVFQNYALYPHMTVYENMAFGLKLRNMPKAEIQQRVTEAARILEITALLDRKPKDMSGGQRQRVAIGRAIVRNPKVFLFDEPLSNLDAKLRGQTRIELQKLHRQLNATIIYVTHDQVEAMTLGDRIVVLRDGAVQQFDTPLALYNQPVNQFVAGFIGTPAMNFLPGRLLRQGSELTFRSQQGSVQISLTNSAHYATLQPHESRDVVLGIRADFISSQPMSQDRPYYSADQPTLIDAVESMGSETLVYFDVEGVRFVGRLPGDTPVRMEQSVALFWDIDKMHFFDSLTQQRLS